MTDEITIEDWSDSIRIIGESRTGTPSSLPMDPLGDSRDDAIIYMMSWRISDLKYRVAPTVGAFSYTLTQVILPKVRAIYPTVDAEIVKKIIDAIANRSDTGTEDLPRFDGYWRVFTSLTAALFWYDSVFDRFENHLNTVGIS